MKISDDPFTTTVVHAFIMIATFFGVQLVDFGWQFWIPAFGSMALCAPPYLWYYSDHIETRPAWAWMLINIVFHLMIFSQIHSASGILHSCDSGTCTSHDWTDGIYFSIVTFTTLGYGDLQPSGYGRFFAASQALIGYVVLGMTVAASSHMAERRSKDANRNT